MTTLALAALLAVPALGASRDDPGESASGRFAARYVASGGLVYEWDGASPKVEPAAPGGDLPGGPETVALEPCGDGCLLLLKENRTAEGKDRSRREGLALILGTGGGAPKRLHEVAFEGRPFSGAITQDGSRGYVLARRPPPGGNEGAGRFWIHEIDLRGGRLLSSAQLSSAPSDIAVQSDGRRVFVTLPNRIQSFSSGPLIISWHYRSPGPNRSLVIRAGDGTICATRGEEVALFDPAAIATRGDAERHGRIDDATAIIPLPFEARDLDLSDDGRLALVQGPDRLAFLDCVTQSLIWPVDPPSGMAEAGDIKTLAFPAAGRDLVLALFPAGDVVALRTPAPPRPSPIEPAPPAPAADASPAPGGPPPPEALPPPPAPAQEGPAQPAPERPVEPTPGSMAAPDDRAAHLGGRVTGDRSRVGAIVLYGPNSIVKEFGRALPGPDGVWQAPLPPPGTYRLVPVGDGSTPLAASPGFRTIKVTSGEGQSGIDFDIRGVPSG